MGFREMRGGKRDFYGFRNLKVVKRWSLGKEYMVYDVVFFKQLFKDVVLVVLIVFIWLFIERGFLIGVIGSVR